MRKTQLGTMLAILILILALAACEDDAGSSSSDVTLGEVHVDARSRFELSLPEGWDVSDSGGFGAELFAINQTPDYQDDVPFAANINVVVSSTQGMSLDAVVESTKDTMSRLFSDYELLSDDAIEIGGVDARILEFTHTQGTLHLRQQQLTLVVDGLGYHVTATALEDTWGGYSATMNASLMSFRVQAGNNAELPAAATPTPEPLQEVYTSGESIPDFPTTDQAHAGRFGGVELAIQGGNTVIRMANGGTAEYSHATYTCIDAGGCLIENGRVTQGRVRVSEGVGEGFGETATPAPQPTATPTPEPPQDAFGPGEEIPDFPTGFDDARRFGGEASLVMEGGSLTLEMSQGGFAEYSHATYTCIDAGGCRIENGRVTQGRIRVSEGVREGVGETATPVPQPTATPVPQPTPTPVAPPTATPVPAPSSGDPCAVGMRLREGEHCTVSIPGISVGTNQFEVRNGMGCYGGVCSGNAVNLNGFTAGSNGDGSWTINGLPSAGADSTPTVEPTSSPTPRAMPAAGDVLTFKHDFFGIHIEFQVLEVWRGYTGDDSSDDFWLDSGNQWIRIVAEIRNLGDDDYSTSSLYFSLTDADHRELGDTFGAPETGDDLFDKEIAPQSSARGDIVMQAPKEAAFLVLRFEPIFFDAQYLPLTPGADSASSSASRAAVVAVTLLPAPRR